MDLRTGEGRRWVLAEFPPPGTPLFAIGDRVPLEFSGPCLSETLVAEAQVVLWSFNDAAFTYGFQVDMPTKESLLGAIHRHRARRVGFSSEEPVGVRIAPTPGQAVFEGLIDNVSVGGVGVMLSPAVDVELKSSYELLLSFELPGCDGLLELIGRTRWRSKVGDGVRYGIQFVPDHVIDSRAQLQRIERFVATRDPTA